MLETTMDIVANTGCMSSINKIKFAVGGSDTSSFAAKAEEACAKNRNAGTA